MHERRSIMITLPKKLKNLFSFMVIILLGIMIIFPVKSLAKEVSNDETYLDLSIKELNQKSGTECLQILEEHGLVLSETYKNDTKLAEESVKMIINDLNNGLLINGAIPYNYTELVQLAKQIMSIAETHDARYTLQNSNVLGSWNDSYLNYNCYGYATGQITNFVNPGYYSNKSFSMNLSIAAMADLVINDLNSLGYNAYKTLTKPTSLSSWERVICIRKGTRDYHFMKGNSTTYWTHKPGLSNPLSWKYNTPSYTIWTNEYSFRNTSYSSTTTYDSSIYYIIYWTKGTGPDISSVISNK